MSAIDELFGKLRKEGRKALMPFITGGDPSLPATAALLQELERRGCALAELGIPYSDPIADGPVIQASYTRALANHVKLEQILDTVRQIPLQMPVVTMVSYAIVYRVGLENYVRTAKAAGVAGAIVPDLLVEEAGPLRDICRAEDFSLIQLVTPTTPRDRAVQIAESSSGFLYYVSVTGITGERTELPPDLADNVQWIRQRTDLPICIGFGISQPEHVKLLSPVADGLIVGSAIMRRIEANASDQQAMLADVGQFVDDLLQAM